MSNPFDANEMLNKLKESLAEKSKLSLGNIFSNNNKNIDLNTLNKALDNFEGTLNSATDEQLIELDSRLNHYLKLVDTEKTKRSTS